MSFISWSASGSSDQRQRPTGDAVQPVATSRSAALAVRLRVAPARGDPAEEFGSESATLTVKVIVVFQGSGSASFRSA